MGGRAAQLAKLVAIYSPWQFVYWYDRPEKSPRHAGGAGSAESVIKTDAATLYYQASEKKKDVVDIKKIKLDNRNEVTVGLIGNSGCVLHLRQEISGQ